MKASSSPISRTQQGTRTSLAHPATIDHLLGLGVTTVELLPIHAMVSEPHLVRMGLVNYWGYQPVSFFAPHPAYSSRRDPLGPADAFMPPVAENTVTASTLAAGADIGKDNGAMDFIANATGAIYAKSWTPQLQKLAAGQQTPDALLASVQKDYESQVRN